MREPNLKLTRAREKAGLTQLQVATQAQIDIKTYQRYEHGLRVPSAPIGNRIADAVHSTSRELFGT